MWRRLVIEFNNRTKRLAISLFRQFNPGPIANGGKEINSIAYQLFRNRSCMLSSRQRYNQRDIDNLFIQGRFLIPMMRADTIAMITRKNDNCILPKSVVINRINNLAYFLINLFHKAVIYIPVSSPVFNGIIYGRVYIEITSFLKLYDSRIVWFFAKLTGIPGQSRRSGSSIFPYGRFCLRAYSQILCGLSNEATKKKGLSCFCDKKSEHASAKPTSE